MASYDSSFNAQGPTVVAFECITPATRAFGAGVNGTQVGVHGEGMASPLGSRAVNVQGTGVHGRGDFHGVYGIDGSISQAQEPNLGNDLPISPPAHAPIGVVGVTQGKSPAVLGDNHILQDEIAAMDKHKVGGLTNLDNARALDVGVEGVSKDGHGVFGLAFTGDLTAELQIPSFLGGGLPAEPGTVTTSGVAGMGVKGPGLLGVSHEDRGGFFISGTSAYGVPGTPQPEGPPVAQIRLYPHYMAATQTPVSPGTPLNTVIPSITTSPANLPKNGRQGDLLFTGTGQGTNCTLWLCVADVQDGTATASCSWAQVLLGPVVTVK